MVRVVLLSGYSGSGKDTVGKMMCEDYGFKRFAFADRLKDYCNIKYDIDINDDTKNNYRTLLNFEGKLHQRKWSQFLARDILEWGGSKVVVTDWRFVHEYGVMKNHFLDIVTVRIHGSTKPTMEFDSEFALDDFKTFDYHIDNIYGMESLKLQVDILMNKINERP